MIFKNWFNKKTLRGSKSTPESPVPKCKHDWEVVETVDLEEVLESIPATRDVDIVIHYVDFIRLWYCDEYLHLSVPEGTKFRFERKVCLECGVCIDQSLPAKQMWKERLDKELFRVQEKDRRKRLAKRMWGNCDHI